ncbi:DNA polymerase III epsilon subunit-like protein [Filibacter limicola]|uniref:DNA polymerase III epsilon subunit-like protein n=1 Tax=Sporosarcina limicola TaxID=34101 RepID=A0A927MRU9_9BACL|nr:DNA polymerase III epsilon subunit-like protein [Sporosarcina limicola]
MDFVAIDFETANSLRSSVCSVGIVQVKNWKIIKEIQSLINP